MYLILIVIVSAVIFMTHMPPMRSLIPGALTGLALALQAGNSVDAVILVAMSMAGAYLTATIAK